MIEKKLLVRLSIPVLLILGFLWYTQGSSPWQTAVHVLAETNGEYTIFDENLERGQTITSRLDLKQGAENHGKLILEMPNGEQMEWTQGYQQTKTNLQVEVSRAGRHRLMLVTLPYDGSDGKSPPEIEVNWFFK